MTASCRDCGTALHKGGNTCIECWRDRREIDEQRNEEWWS